MAANEEVKAPRLTGRPKIHHGYETRLAFEVLLLLFEMIFVEK